MTDYGARRWQESRDKNNFEADSRSFIHRIGAGSHYEPREMHLDAVSDARVRKHA